MGLNILAPGVYSSITDLSTFVNTAPGTTGFIAVITESGRDNQLVLVDRARYFQEFGNPNLNYTNDKRFGIGPYVADNFLTESNNLYVIRCMPTAATYANIFITTTSTLDDLDSSGNVDDQDITCEIDSLASLSTMSLVEAGLSSGIDDTSAAGYNLVAFRGLGRGEYYNNVLIDVNKHPNSGLLGVRQDLYIIDVYLRQKYTNRLTTGDTTNSGYAYADYTLVETFEVSFDPDAKDELFDSLFVEDVVNNYSNLIRVTAQKTILQEIARRSKLDVSGGYLDIDFSAGFVRSHTNSSDDFQLTYGNPLANGDHGGLFTRYGINTDTTSAAYPGNLLAKAYSGILPSAFDGTGSPLVGVLDTENYQFDVVFDAGYPSDESAVKTAIVELASVRRDCLAIIDNGEHYTAAAAIANRTEGDTFAYNTPFASIYEPYTKVRDNYLGTDIFMPPSYHVAKIIGYNDRTTEIWYPLAGFNRAVINSIKEMRYNPSLADRENFIKYQINPIVKFGIGYALFSQRTTLRKSSALQEIHIIRLQMHIDRLLRNFCTNFIFELNDEETRSQIRKEINVLLSEIKTKRGLKSFSISTPSSEYDIKRRRISVNIILEPTRSVEQIHLSYAIN